MADRVQWNSGGSGVGVRSWALYGITKVHLTDDGHTTLCGVSINRRNRFPSPDKPEQGNDCRRCERKANERNNR